MLWHQHDQTLGRDSNTNTRNESLTIYTKQPYKNMQWGRRSKFHNPKFRKIFGQQGSLRPHPINKGMER